MASFATVVAQVFPIGSLVPFFPPAVRLLHSNLVSSDLAVRHIFDGLVSIVRLIELDKGKLAFHLDVVDLPELLERVLHVFPLDLSRDPSDEDSALQMLV